MLWGHPLDPFLSIDNIFFPLTVLSQPVSGQGAEFSFLLMVLKKLLRNQNTFQSYLQGLLWFKWFLEIHSADAIFQSFTGLQMIVMVY